jgi:hypothetical protein
MSKRAETSEFQVLNAGRSDSDEARIVLHDTSTASQRMREVREKSVVTKAHRSICVGGSLTATLTATPLNSNETRRTLANSQC